MDIDEIRRINLQTLADENGGVVKLADLLGKDQSQVSQWIRGSINSGTGKPRGMRAATCREIERTCGKPSNWLDQDHTLLASVKANDVPLWPFANISYEKVKQLSQRDLIRLEAGIEIVAKDLGLDIVETNRPPKTEVA